MKRILVTGATGNIGAEVIRFLNELSVGNIIIAGVRNIEKAKLQFGNYPSVTFSWFDFENPESFEKSLDHIDTVFLLRPPHISDVKKYFTPLLTVMTKKGIKEVLFLSVQGAEKSSFIPHNKIEKQIKDSGISYIFLRPGYFMQNLSSTLYHDINERREIILPSAKAKFNWIDTQNIGEACALLLCKFDLYKNNAFDITGYENLDFYKVTEIFNKVIDRRIVFRSVNPLRFFMIKRREGLPSCMILVMIMLHILPRVQKEPAIVDFYEQLTGKKPISLKEFIQREKDQFC